MNAKQKIHQAKMAKWAALIKDQAESGLTIRQWCNQTGYTFHAYNYWKHLLKETALKDVTLPEIVPLSPPSVITPSLPAPTHNVEVPSHDLRELRESTKVISPVSISLGDIHIEIGSNASDDVISGIIKAVRHA